MSAYCPACHTLQKTSPTGQVQRVGWSAQYQRIDLHKKPDKNEICEGSGAYV
jgi:hypothetical protein